MLEYSLAENKHEAATLFINLGADDDWWIKHYITNCIENNITIDAKTITAICKTEWWETRNDDDNTEDNAIIQYVMSYSNSMAIMPPLR